MDGAAKYDVYRSNSADGTFSKVGSTDKTTYVNTGAVKGVTYFYKIRAVGASGASGFSNTVAIHVARRLPPWFCPASRRMPPASP